MHDMTPLDTAANLIAPEHFPRGYFMIEVKNQEKAWTLFRTRAYKAGGKDDTWIIIERTPTSKDKPDAEILASAIITFERSLHGYELIINPNTNPETIKKFAKYGIDVTENMLIPKETVGAAAGALNMFLLEFAMAYDLDGLAFIMPHEFRAKKNSKAHKTVVRIMVSQNEAESAFALIIQSLAFENPDVPDIRYISIPDNLKNSIFHRNKNTGKAPQRYYYEHENSMAFYVEYMDAWTFFTKDGALIRKIPKAFKHLAETGVSNSSIKHGIIQ
jgi:hypothetical protein